jgi:hypothetical protein
MRIVHSKNRDEDITVEEARTFECCKNLTDEQITELLETIRTFTEITYYTFASKEKQEDGGNNPYNIAS